jgi:hypothetical protein
MTKGHALFGMPFNLAATFSKTVKMNQHSPWSPYVGGDALLLPVTLIIIAGVLAYLGTRLRRSVGVQRPGTAVTIFLVVIWILSFLTLENNIGTYVRALIQQKGPITVPANPISVPANPISPITGLSALATFIIISYLSRHHGWKIALGSAIVGTIAAPMIFELPFDLIVMWRTYPPAPATAFTLLYFLPLFLWEISSFALLTWSPLMNLSKYTLFAIAAMFLVFAVWACFGFSYPSNPISFGLNVASKILSFVVAVTLFVPQNEHALQGF